MSLISKYLVGIEKRQRGQVEDATEDFGLNPARRRPWGVMVSSHKANVEFVTTDLIGAAMLSPILFLGFSIANTRQGAHTPPGEIFTEILY